jgi:hypothetical protein
MLPGVESRETFVAGSLGLPSGHAASVQLGDSHMTRGVPYVMRPIFSVIGAMTGSLAVLIGYSVLAGFQFWFASAHVVRLPRCPSE